MDQTNTQNSSGMMNGMPPMPHQEKKVGPIVGALIIILVLIIAALYFFGQRLNTSSPASEVAPAVETQESLGGTSAQSDDVSTLEADLNAQLNDVDYSF